MAETQNPGQDEKPEVTGLTQEVREKLKKKWGVVKAATIADGTYAWRQMSKAEHSALVESGAMNGDDAEMNMIKEFVVFPAFKDIDFESAAFLEQTLAQNILQLAGFGNTSEPITL